MFEIEAGIPVPETRRFRNRRSYPWARMNVGDCFFVPPRPEETVAKLQESISSTGIGAGKRLGMRFTVRQTEGGVRVWRVQ